MIVSYSITKNQKPTPEQIAEIREAAKRPIVFDEDCPEMTDEQLRQFKRVHLARRALVDPLFQEHGVPVRLADAVGRNDDLLLPDFRLMQPVFH